MISSRIFIIALLAGICILPNAAGATTFVDPLDAPAVKTVRAVSSLLMAVVRSGDRRLVAVGQLGNIVLSDDAGKTWTQADVPLSVNLLSVRFATPERGWATGHYGVILTTTDGGQHWHRQLDGREANRLIHDYYRRRVAAGEESMERYLRAADLDYQNGPAQAFLDAWFTDTHTGYAVGSFGLIMRTDDDGKTWTPWMDRVDNPAALHLNAILGAEAGLFIASERGTVFRLDETQQRFVPTHTGYKGTFFGLVGDRDYVMAFGLHGNAYKSKDAGKHWLPVVTGTQSNINGGTILDDGRVVLVCQSGEVLVSRDHGDHFAVLPSHSGEALTAVSEISGNKIAIVGQGGLHVESLGNAP